MGRFWHKKPYWIWRQPIYSLNSNSKFKILIIKKYLCPLVPHSLLAFTTLHLIPKPSSNNQQQLINHLVYNFQNGNALAVCLHRFLIDHQPLTLKHHSALCSQFSFGSNYILPSWLCYPKEICIILHSAANSRDKVHHQYYNKISHFDSE